MLKPQRMVKVGIVCPNTLLEKAINSLYELKALHIEDYEKANEFDIGHPLKHGEELSELLVKLRSIASYTNIDLNLGDYKKQEVSYDAAKATIEKHHQNIKARLEKVEYYKKVLAILKKRAYRQALETIVPESKRTKDVESLCFCGFTRKDIEKDALLISETSFVYTKDVDNVSLVLMLLPKAKKQQLLELLKANLFLGVEVSEIKKLQPEIKAGIIDSYISPEILQKNTAKEEKALKDELLMIKRNYENYLLNANETIEQEIEKTEAPMKFAASKNMHVISGWVPLNRFEKIKKALEEKTSNKIYVEMIPLKDGEVCPVMLKNPKPTNSFQLLLDLFAIPTYKEIDPTLLMFITFPMFFGFMLGDIGYGFLTLAAFSLAKLKFNKGAMKALLNILIISSIGTIIFGFLFGEFFGEEVIFGYQLPHILSRAHQINELLIISIIIGLVHINFGLLLGFINTYQYHGLKHAILEKFGWVVLQAGIALAILGLTGILQLSFYWGLSLAAIGAVMLYLGEGLKGIIELPSIFSNILSYARLMAVGLASVELAIIVNELAKEMFHKGGFLIIAGAAILLFGHTINLALGLIGPFLHSLRLHYVEFFGKFYRGGGKKFVAFGERQKNK